MIKPTLVVLFLISSFVGCGTNEDTTATTSTDTVTTTTTVNEPANSIEIFTSAPVLNAAVKDANGQIALYSSDLQRYIFPNNITYPITAQTTENTFVDVDYDGKKTAVDILPKFTTLKSFCQNINLLTTLYYNSYFQDTNTTISSFRTNMKNNYNVADVCNNEESARVSFALANYMFTEGVTSSFDLIGATNISLTDSEMTKKITEIDSFYDNTLNYLQDESTKTKYYSIYNSLINLDKRIFKRVDTLHIPNIPTLLRSPLNVTNRNTEITTIFDIVLRNSSIYIALGHDSITTLNLDLTKSVPNIVDNSNIPLSSFSSNFYMEDYNNSSCLFVTNGLAGITTYDITTAPGSYKQDISSYGTNNPFSQEGGVFQTNGYVSEGELKRLLAISTVDKGFYLINIKDSMQNCSLTRDINSSDFLLEETSGRSTSSAFRQDGTYLYLTNNNKVRGYNTSNLTKKDVEASKVEFALSTTAEYYNLLLVNSDNDLFTTTNRGLEIYNITSNNSLELISTYLSEGAENEYFSKMDKYENFLMFTDAKYGVKILKLDSDLQPELCGIAYFSLLDTPTELAKVTSLKYDNNSLYVSISNYGIEKINFESMLFEHCK